MGYKRIKKKKFFKKGLPKFQIRGQVTGVPGMTEEEATESFKENTPDNKVLDETGTEVVDTGIGDNIYMLDSIKTDPIEIIGANQIPTDDQEVQSAMLNEAILGPNVEETPTSPSSPSHEDIIMEAIKMGKKVKLNPDGSIKKIKKTGGIAPGKFLRRGGSIGRKFL